MGLEEGSTIRKRRAKDDSKSGNGDCKSHAVVDDEANDDDIVKSKTHIFVDQVHSYIETGQLTWQDVRDEANVIVAAVSN